MFSLILFRQEDEEKIIGDKTERVSRARFRKALVRHVEKLGLYQ